MCMYTYVCMCVYIYIYMYVYIYIYTYKEIERYISMITVISMIRLRRRGRAEVQEGVALLVLL